MFQGQVQPMSIRVYPEFNILYFKMLCIFNYSTR